MVLRKYVSDPSIAAMLGSASGVRFTGKITEKLDDGKTVVVQIEMPDHAGSFRSTVKLIGARYKKVSVMDTITGVGDFTRHFEGNKVVMEFTPNFFAVRNASGRQVT